MLEPVVRRVVIADDDPDILEILTLNLELAGYEVQTAFDGEAARDLVVRTVPDLVVLDVMMPKLDGIEVLCALKARPQTRDIPVVMLTARGTDDDLWQGWTSGADYYITKPFELEELLRFIDFLRACGRVPT